MNVILKRLKGLIFFFCQRKPNVQELCLQKHRLLEFLFLHTIQEEYQTM